MRRARCLPGRGRWRGPRCWFPPTGLSGGVEARSHVARPNDRRERDDDFTLADVLAGRSRSSGGPPGDGGQYSPELRLAWTTLRREGVARRERRLHLGVGDPRREEQEHED